MTRLLPALPLPSFLLPVLGLLGLPTAAWAEVCDKVRPDWDGAPVSAVQELLNLGASLPVLVLLVASALVIRLRSQWGGLAVIVAWTVLASVVILRRDAVMQLAAEEGCVGAPSLFVALVAAICVAIVIYTLPRLTADDTPDGDGD